MKPDLWYILDDDNNPKPVDPITSCRWLHDHPERKIVKQTTVQSFFVSTVFLGLDHGYGSVPILWETMVFDLSGADCYMERYSSYADAVQGHDSTIKSVEDGTIKARED